MVDWLTDGYTPKEEVFEAVTLDKETLTAAADYFGLDVIPDNDGNLAVAPMSTPQGAKDIPGFFDYWTSESTEKASAETVRAARYRSYELMDRLMPEAMLVLDTYADEMFGVGFVDDPIEIKIKGMSKSVSDAIMETIRKSRVIENARGLGRLMCKWGEFGWLLNVHDADDPSSISITTLLPTQYKAVTPNKSPVPVAYKIEPRSGIKWTRKDILGLKKRTKDIYPWELVTVGVPDMECVPYGRSVLEPMRVPFDQLVTIEALLALSRASRVERLIVKVPTGQRNPTAALTKMNTLKSVWKNMIISNNQGRTAHGRTPALQDILFMPSDDGFSIDRLASSIDVSNTEDVEYFRDKALMMSGLPKGYFLADQSTDRGNALAAQDLKFARKLIPSQDAFAKGLVKLVVALAVHHGVTPDSFTVDVNIKRPSNLSDETITQMSSITRAAGEMITSWKEAYSISRMDADEVKVPDGMFSNLLTQLGLPKNIVDVFPTTIEKEPKPVEEAPITYAVRASTASKSVQGLLTENYAALELLRDTKNG